MDVHKYVEIDERLFRPHEVPLLLGDYSKAKSNLGWDPQIKFKQLARLMYEEDLNFWKSKTDITDGIRKIIKEMKNG